MDWNVGKYLKVTKNGNVVCYRSGAAGGTSKWDYKLLINWIGDTSHLFEDCIHTSAQLCAKNVNGILWIIL